ncbi:hypothetical protein NE865_00698 [Phthorimaea operculella]|nr:hypothetical protein NE865_00698 [Phthorimaea operculella]
MRSDGLKLQGATVKGNRLLLTNTIMVDLPLTVLTWIRSDGLKLQGATVKGNRLLLTNTIMVDLPLTVLTWIRGPEPVSGGQTLTLPVYLNSARSELLFTVRLPIAAGQEPHAFYERGVALLTSTALN